MDMPAPQPEHKWLQQLVGRWRYEGEYTMGPDQPPIKNTGIEVVEPLGEFWTIGRMSGAMPSGGTSHSVMSLGYDPQQQRFVGTFIASVMTFMWIYNGGLDETGRVLVLDCEGPSFAEEGKMAKYQDILEIVNDNERILRSQFLGPDGQWVPFMKSVYRREAAQ